MNSASAVASILKAEQVQYLFCFPVNPLIDECARLDIRSIVGRTERTLVNMADAYSRVNNGRKIGVVAVQHGPGAENAYAGVAQAYSDGSPVLFLPGGNPLELVGLPPNYDAAAAFRAISKWSARIAAPRRVPPFLRRAFSLMRNGRPGPVVLELPIDVAFEEVEAFTYKPAVTVRSEGDPADVRVALKMLLAAERPVLHVGQGVLWAEAWDELRELAELLCLPVMTTLTGKSAFPEDHPLALGAGGNSTTGMVGHFLKSSDLVFGVGCSFTSTPFGTAIPPHKTIVHVTRDEGDLNKDVGVDHAVLGDAKLVLRQLIDEAKRQGVKRHSEALVAEIARVKQAWLAHWMPKLSSDEVPINPYRVVRELSRATDHAQTILTHDSGMPRDQLVPFWEATAPRGYLGWGKSTQLGSSLGFALGAKLARPEKLSVHFLGDTAFGMCGMDLETAAREKLPTLTILLNNGLMGGYDKYIPVASEKYQARFHSGNYSKLAEGLGVSAQQVRHPGELASAIAKAIETTKAGTPAMIEVFTREETTLSKGMPETR